MDLTYNSLNWPMVNAFLSHLLNALHAADYNSQLSDPVKIVDYGCGDGNFGLKIANHFHEHGNKISYLGLDREEISISAANKTFASAPEPIRRNAQFNQHFWTISPFQPADHATDIAIIANSLYSATRKLDKFMQPIIDGLSPNGLMIILHEDLADKHLQLNDFKKHLSRLEVNDIQYYNVPRRLEEYFIENSIVYEKYPISDNYNEGKGNESSAIDHFYRDVGSGNAENGKTLCKYLTQEEFTALLHTHASLHRHYPGTHDHIAFIATGPQGKDNRKLCNILKIVTNDINNKSGDVRLSM